MLEVHTLFSTEGVQIFIVGGYVRDRLLGRESKDHDFVVVGATAEQMLDAGFQQVGTDFPVFLSSLGDEFALARTERKTGSGYKGFETEFGTDITLEEDLARRDLTINSMAREVVGFNDLGHAKLNDLVIDLFNGQQDLEYGILRHVSEAFAEDPVRVLRVARFAARYGFKVAPETVELMNQLTLAGELDHLTPERVWSETERALMEPDPDLFFEELFRCEALEILFPGLRRPLSNALLRAAAQAKPVEARFAALMLEMDEIAAERLFIDLKVPTTFVTQARKLRRLVTDVMVRDDPEWNLMLLKDLDAFRMPDLFQAVCSATLAIDKPSLWEATFVLRLAHQQAMKVSFASLTKEQRETLQGPAIGAALDELRIEAIAEI